jgi:hypothetical protein
MKKILGFLLLAAPLATTSCATIVNGSSQTVSVQAVANGSVVPAASCNLQNGKNTEYLTAPGSVIVNHSGSDLVVSCSHPSYGSNTVREPAQMSGWVAGNLLIGGIIGIIVDFTDGDAYNYPSTVVVPLAAPAKPVS